MPVLAHLTPRLPVGDLSRTVAFYRELLAFEVDVSWPHGRPTFVILRRDKTTIGFFEPSEHQPGPIGYAELYLEVVDARGLHDALKPRMAIEWGPEIYSYGRLEFAIRDPDGYLIIFTEPAAASPTTREPA